MPKTPKSVTVIVSLAIAGIQAVAELIKAAKSEPQEKPKDEKKDE